MSVTASDIATDFPDANCNPELVKICMRICNDHRITAGDLATNWELLMMNRKGKNAQLTLETLGELEAETKLILERESNKRQKVGSRPGSFGGQFPRGRTQTPSQRTRRTCCSARRRALAAARCSPA